MKMEKIRETIKSTCERYTASTVIYLLYIQDRVQDTQNTKKQ